MDQPQPLLCKRGGEYKHPLLVVRCDHALLLKCCWTGFQDSWLRAGTVNFAQHFVSCRRLLRKLRLRHHVAHGDDYLSRTAIWISPVGREHVVEHENVTLLPGEADRGLSIQVADFTHHRVFNRRPIAVTDIAWIICFAKQ